MYKITKLHEIIYLETLNKRNGMFVWCKNITNEHVIIHVLTYYYIFFKLMKQSKEISLCLSIRK